MAEGTHGENWERGAAYERYVGRWSRLLAPRFLAWLGVPAGRRWLDVGCGTGAVCAAILKECSPAAVTGVEPSAGFLAAARERLEGRATLLSGSATAIPRPDAAVDAVVSGLVLNFVAEPAAALAEMVRVTAPGGTVAAYVWDYGGKMEMMQRFWDAAVALDPAAARFHEGARFKLCRPEPLTALFAGAGLGRVTVTALELATPFADFDDYWEPFLGGQGSAPTYLTRLAEPARARLRERLRASLPAGADGSIALVARAWAARGEVGTARLGPTRHQHLGG